MVLQRHRQGNHHCHRSAHSRDDDGIGFVGHLTTLMLAQDVLIIVAAEPSTTPEHQFRVHLVDRRDQTSAEIGLEARTGER